MAQTVFFFMLLAWLLWVCAVPALATAGSTEFRVAVHIQFSMAQQDKAIQERLLNLGTFLAERSVEHGANVHLGTHLASPASGVRVHLTLPAVEGRPDECLLEIWEGDVLLAERLLDVQDEVHSKVTAWLVLKSSLQRMVSRPPAPPAVEEEISPVHEEAAPSAAGERAFNPVVLEPSLERPTWSLHGHLNAANEVVNRWSVGPSVGVSYYVADSGPLRAVLDVDVGYRFADLSSWLRMHQLPVRVSAAMLLGPGRSARLGLTGQWVGKWAHAAPQDGETVRALAWGAELGPYVQIALGIAEGAGLLLRMSLERRLRPLHYQGADDGVLENPWVWNFGVGWELEAVH